MALQKRFKIVLKEFKFLSEPKKLQKMSSTNKKWVTDLDSKTAIPLRRPLEWASFIIMLSASATIGNKKEERGNPCQMPLDALKNRDEALLIRMDKGSTLNAPHYPINHF
jgi:hypothetical protein